MSEQKRPESGCPFHPPAPTPPEKPGSILGVLLRARQDLLRDIPEVNYNILMGQRRLGLRDLFFVNSPAAVREILKRDADNYPKSRQMYRALEPLVGDGIFISNGATWRRRRRMVNPAFENVRLRVAFPVMLDAVDDMLDRLARLPEDEVVNLDAEMAHVTADIIFRAIFSTKLTQRASRDIFEAFSHYQEGLPQFDIIEMLGLPDWVPRGSLRKARQAAGRIRGVLRELIAERMEAPSRKTRDILDVLICSRDDEGRGLDLEELVDEVAVLFLAGHETSATALTWAVYLASQQPDIERRLVDEVSEIFSGPQTRFEDINRLELTRNVFKESLRLYPPVSFITREPIEERRITRWRIRKNSMMVISPWVIQRHRLFWSRPDCFDPDRYGRTETRESENQAYLPFGSGQRACPGASFAMLEGPLILASLFHRFRVEPIPGVKPYPVCRLTTRPREKILVRLYPRNTEQVET